MSATIIMTDSDLWVYLPRERRLLFTEQSNDRVSIGSITFPPSFIQYFELADFKKNGSRIFSIPVEITGLSAVWYIMAFIYLNDKTNHFDQAFFFPVHGCYKILPDLTGVMQILPPSLFMQIILINRGRFCVS